MQYTNGHTYKGEVEDVEIVEGNGEYGRGVPSDFGSNKTPQPYTLPRVRCDCVCDHCVTAYGLGLSGLRPAERVLWVLQSYLICLPIFLIAILGLSVAPLSGYKSGALCMASTSKGH